MQHIAFIAPAAVIRQSIASRVRTLCEQMNVVCRRSNLKSLRILSPCSIWQNQDTEVAEPSVEFCEKLTHDRLFLPGIGHLCAREVEVADVPCRNDEVVDESCRDYLRVERRAWMTGLVRRRHDRAPFLRYQLLHVR